MIVIDASAVLELLLKGPAWQRVASRIAAEEELHAPHLLDLEVAQHPHDLSLPRIWELRARVTAYDAAYLALAGVLAAPLVTLDRRLAHAGGPHARIEIPG